MFERMNNDEETGLFVEHLKGECSSMYGCADCQDNSDVRRYDEEGWTLHQMFLDDQETQHV